MSNVAPLPLLAFTCGSLLAAACVGRDDKSHDPAAATSGTGVSGASARWGSGGTTNSDSNGSGGFSVGSGGSDLGIRGLSAGTGEVSAETGGVSTETGGARDTGVGAGGVIAAAGGSASALGGSAPGASGSAPGAGDGHRQWRSCCGKQWYGAWHRRRVHRRLGGRLRRWEPPDPVG